MHPSRSHHLRKHCFFACKLINALPLTFEKYSVEPKMDCAQLQTFLKLTSGRDLREGICLYVPGQKEGKSPHKIAKKLNDLVLRIFLDNLSLHRNEMILECIGCHSDTSTHDIGTETLESYILIFYCNPNLFSAPPFLKL